MDVLVANPEKFVGEHLRVRGKMGHDPTFSRNTQSFVLIPIGCEASEGGLGDPETVDALMTCYGSGIESLIAVGWSLQVLDELDIAAGDILTIEATIGALGAGESRYFTFYGDPGQSSLVLPVVSIEKERQ